MCFSDFFAPEGHFVSAIKQMRFFFSACTSEYESSFLSFSIRITKNSRLLIFAAAILRSCDDRSVDRNNFSGVCNERKIIEKFSEDPIIRREKSEATRLSRFSVPDLAVAKPRFYSSKWLTQTSINCYCNRMQRMVVRSFFGYLILPSVEPLPQAVLINKTCICHPWIKEQTSFWTV